MTKVTNIEIKQDKNGNDMKVTTFDNSVKVFVNSKYDAVVYDKVVVGAEFEVYKDEKDYWKIKYDKPVQQRAPNGFGKTALMDKAMEKKHASIKEFQGTKEESIKMAGAIRDAVLITTAIMQHRPLTVSEIESTIQEWQYKIYNLHDQPFLTAPVSNTEESEPEEDINPSDFANF